MSTMLIALALSSSVQAQDAAPTQVYDTQCTRNVVQVGVKVRHTEEQQPDLGAGLLYVDAFSIDLGCTGQVSQEQLDALYDQVVRSCTSTSPGYDACLQLSADVVDVLGKSGGIATVDHLSVGDLTQDEKGFLRGRLTIDLGGKEEDASLPIRIRDDGAFASARKIRRTDLVEGLQMACEGRDTQAAAGSLQPTRSAARIDFREVQALHCLTDQDPSIQREVWLDIDYISVAATPTT